MKWFKALIFGISLFAMGSAVIAGEDSTHRVHCTGQSFSDIGLQNFDPAKADCDGGR
ncbi:MAG TPA: hypothetical protein VF936_02205 [Burkholderiales bacterium]